MTKRKAKATPPASKDGPDPECLHCGGKGIYSEYAKVGISVRIRLGRSGKPLPCSKCWERRDLNSETLKSK